LSDLFIYLYLSQKREENKGKKNEKKIENKHSIDEIIFYGNLKKAKTQEKSKRMAYIWVSLLGFEESQIIPVWPHKSIARFQFKLPFDVNEL